MKLPLIIYCGTKQVRHTSSKYALSTLGPHLSGWSMRKMEPLPQGYFQPFQDSDSCDTDSQQEPQAHQDLISHMPPGLGLLCDLSPISI